MFWEILGIEPTKNKTEITNAYRIKLMETNPEDKPEEFKQLRQAYEEALKYADFNEDNLSKIDQMIAKLDEIYKDMHKRSSLDEWKNLLNEEVFKDLNSRDKAMEEMFGYFLDNYRLPHEMWVYFNEEFDLLNRVDELKEKLPPEFVDYIIVDGINYEEPLLYSMYNPGLDYVECEEYLKIFLQVRNLSYAESKPLFEQLRNMNESHPTAEGFMLACEVVEGYPEKLEDLKKLCEDTNYYHRIAQLLTDTYIALERYEEAVTVAEKGLENDPDDNGLRLKYADALAGNGRYNDAIDQLHDLMNRSGGDDNKLDMLGERRSKWNEQLIKQYTQKPVEELSDEDRLMLAWAYVQNELYEDASRVYNLVNKENVESFSYNNLSSAIAEYEHRYLEAITYIDLLVEEILSMKEDGTEKTAKRMKRAPEMISRKAYIYYEMGEVDKSQEILDEALSLDPDDANILTQAAKVAYLQKQYERCEKYSERLIKVNPQGYHGYLLMAKALFKMFRDREAYEYINHSIDINGSDLDAYLLKLRLLIRNSADEASRELLKFLEDNGVKGVLEMDFCKAMIVEYFDNKVNEASDMYKEITTQIDEGGFIEDPAAVFYRYVVAANDSLDGNKKEDRDVMFDIVNRGLKYDPESRSLLDYRAWLLRKDGQNKESLEIYLKLAENPNHGSNTDYQIGDIYFDDLDENADKSYQYFKAAYDKGDKDALYYLVYTLFYMDELDEAEKYCMIYREHLKEKGIIDIDSYYRMSFIEEKRKNYEKALEENEVALNHAIERNVKIYYYLNHKVRLLRFLNRFDEAADVLISNKTLYDEKYYYETLYKVYIQAGMYKKAMDVIDEWAKNKNVGDSHYPYKVELYLLMNEYRKAKAYKDKNFLKMKKDDIKQADQYLDEYDNNHAALIKYYQDKINNSKDPSNFNLIQLAVAYKEAGIANNAYKAAKEALDHFVKTTPKFSQYKALDHIFLAKIYICLDEFDTAKKHIDMARNSTCSHCTYCACKDADQYEAFMYIEMGEYDKALELLESKIDLWKDDLSFGEYIRLINKRKRNK